MVQCGIGVCTHACYNTSTYYVIGRHDAGGYNRSGCLGGFVLCWMFARSILDNPASLKRRAGLDFVWIGVDGLCWDKYLLEFDSTVRYSTVQCTRVLLWTR